MKQTVLLWLFFYCCVATHAQSDSILLVLQEKYPSLEFEAHFIGTPLISVKTKPKLGFSTPKTPAIYDELTNSLGYFAAARRDSVWGLIDTTGKEVGPWNYQSLSKFNSSSSDFKYWQTERNGKKGAISYQSKEVLLPEYDNIWFSDGMYHIEKDNKWGVNDTNGKVILPIIYDEISIKQEKYFLVENDSLKGLMEMGTFKPILPIEYQDISISYNGGFIITKNKLKGFADENGKIIVEPSHKEVSSTGKWVLISDSTYTRLKDKIEIEHKDKNNQLVINMASCKQDSEKVSLYGMIDREGKMIFTPIYEHIYYWGDNLFKVRQNGKEGIISLEQKLILPIQYDQIINVSNHLIVTQKDTFQTLQSLKGKLIDSNFYSIQEIDVHEQTYIWVYHPNKLAILDTLGNVLNSYSFDKGHLIKFNEFHEKGSIYTIYSEMMVINVGGEKWYFASKGKAIAKGNNINLKENWFTFILLESWIQKGEKRIYNYMVLNKKAEKMYEMKGIDEINDYYDQDTRNLIARYGIIPISKNGKYGYLNINTGKMITPFLYKDADYFENGVGKVEPFKGDDFYIDRLGNKLLHIPKKENFDFVKADANSYKGIVDIYGNMIVPTNYFYLYVNPNYIIANDNIQKHIFDYSGKRLLEQYNILEYKDTLFMVENKDKKTGIIDLNEKVIIPFDYEEIKVIDTKYAVKKNGKWALYSLTLKALTPYQYTEIDEFSINAFWVEQYKTWQLIDSLGNKLNPNHFDYISYNNNNYTCQIAIKNNKFVVINYNGTLLSPFQPKSYFEYHKVWGPPFDVHSDAIIVREKGKYYFISTHYEFNKHNEKIPLFHVSAKYDSIYGYNKVHILFENHLAKVGKNGLWGLVDNQGREKLAPIYKDIEYQKDNNGKDDDYFLLTQTNGKYSLYFPTQSYLSPTEYPYIGKFSEGLATYSDDKKLFGYIDTLGKIVIPAQYNIAEPFKYDLAVVQVNEKTGLIDRTGKWLIEPQYEALSILSENIICIKQNCKFRLCDTHNQSLSLEYDMIFRESYNFIVFKDLKLGLLDSLGKEEIPCMFSHIVRLYRSTQHLYEVTQNEKKGVWDIMKNRLLIPMEYEKIYEEEEMDNKYFFRAVKNNKVGIIDDENKVVIPFEYPLDSYYEFEIGNEKYKFDPKCKCLKVKTNISHKMVYRNDNWNN